MKLNAQGLIKKEKNFWVKKKESVLLMNTDANIQNRILVSQIQKLHKKNSQVVFIPSVHG